MSTAGELPNALAVGPMKGGTTWLHDYLESRGDVCLPGGAKETFFFDRHSARGEAWYRAHFRHFDPARHKRVMEVGPSYFHCVEAPARIRATLGDVPLIVTLRDPVHRAWSHYLHMVRYGLTTAPLHEAVTQFPEILEASRYDTMLQRWWGVFGMERVRILRYEDLADSAQAFARSACEMLSLDAGLGEAGRERSNAAAVARFPRLGYLAYRAGNVLRSRRLYFLINSAKRLGLKSLLYGKPGDAETRRLPDRERDWLAERLAPEVARLRSSTGRDFGGWLHA